MLGLGTYHCNSGDITEENLLYLLSLSYIDPNLLMLSLGVIY